jgi:exodeoxyribonuclease V beta subunit
VSTPRDLLQVLAPGTHVLEASAGTGKTWTITTLVASALALGVVAPSKVLAVTFTRAATAELRVRVRERLAELAASVRRPDAAHDDHDVVRALLDRAMADADATRDESVVRAQLHARLVAALADADAIGVDTMHGWSATLLAQYGDLLGLEAPLADGDGALPPVAELTERGALVASASTPLHEWLGFAARTASPKGLAQVAQAVLAGVARVRIVSATDAPLDEGASAMDARLARVVERAQALHAHLGDEWRAHRDAFIGVLTEGLQQKRLSGSKWRDAWIASRAEALDLLLTDVTACYTADAEQLKTLAYFGSASLAGATNKGHAAITLGDFSDTIDALLEVLPAVHERLALPMRRFVETVQGALPRRADDFDDLLRLVAEGLVREPAVRERVRRSADLVLIDEFQDTDPLQWRIFSSLFHDSGDAKRLVLVGDPKQSIYRFRNAEVAVYLAARTMAGGDPHTLGTNFRSDPSLVAAVNAVYAAAPGIFGDGVEYAPVEARRSQPELLPPTSTPLTFVAIPTEVASRNVHAMRHAVAEDVARRIAAVLRPESTPARTIVRRGEERRPVRPRDCAVLVPTNRHGWLVVRALRTLGVHAVAASRQAVTQGGTARDVYALLAAIEAPGDRAALRRAALTSLVRPALDLDLQDPPYVILDVLDGEAGRRFDEALREARRSWESRGVMDAWIALDRALSLSHHAASGEDAERRLTDVRHLLELLAANASRTRATPTDTLRWLAEHIAEREVDQITAEELEERLESDEDAVRVITTHASKGLEFPLVWIPFAWTPLRLFSTSRDKPLVRRYDAEAAAVEGVIPVTGGSRAQHPVAQREHAALLLEQQRLLYVGLTRARNACTVYLSDEAKHAESPLGCLLGAGKGDRKSAGTPASARVRALAAVADNGIALEPMDAAPVVMVPPPRVASVAVQATPWRRDTALDGWWRRGSFTALTRGAHGAADRGLDVLADLEPFDDVREPAADEGDEAGVRAASGAGDHPPAAIVGARVPLADVPRGRAVGNALHDVFERAVQQRAAPGLVATLVPEALARQGMDAATWSAPMATALEAALDVPLPGLGAPPPTLRTLAMGTTFTELTFDFAVASAPGRGVRARQLARAFAEHPGGAVTASYADRIAALDFTPLRGLLNGAIDLVARHGDAWVLLDYKSNHLGDAPSDYAHAAMTHAMQEHHYILQYHLYLVALHRYLRLRQSAYDYDRHVGGIAYLFVRGMDAMHEGAGVFTDRPPRARIEALDAALRTGETL